MKVLIFLYILLSFAFSVMGMSKSETICTIDSKESSTNNNSSEVESTNYICEGTLWVTSYLDFGETLSFDDLKIFTSKKWIEGSEEINGRTYMKVWSASEKHDFMTEGPNYIRTEGERVYMLKPQNHEEKLLFDFSLSPGDFVDIDIVYGGAMSEYGDIYSMECVDKIIEENSGNMFHVISFNAHKNGELLDPSFFGKIKWIKGIGSNAGLLDNFISPEEGGFTLTSVYHDGKLIYASDLSSINDIRINNIESANSPKYHLDGTPYVNGESGIFIKNGKKYILK